MPTVWNLRSVLKERGINRASEISRLIGERTGYQLSTQAVCDLLNTEPKMIRLETIQAFCDAFYFRLGDVLDVLPSAAREATKKDEQSGFCSVLSKCAELFIGVMTVVSNVQRSEGNNICEQVSKPFNNL